MNNTSNNDTFMQSLSLLLKLDCTLGQVESGFSTCNPIA